MENSSVISVEDNRVLVNLGSGHKKFEGFTNVDSDPTTEPDIISDIREVKTLFKPNSVDEVHMYHVIEHLTQPDAETIMKDIYSILKSGGSIVLECPDIVKCAINLLQTVVDGDRERVERFGLLGLYGDPRYKSDAMTHKWGYWPEYMCGILEGIGYINFSVEKPLTKDFAATKRDMRVVGFKP